jgi:hypothetical protein
MKNALTFCDGGRLQRSGIFVVTTHNESLSPATFYVARGVIYSEPSLDDAAPGRSLDFLWAGDFKKLPQKALRLWGSKFPSRPKATQGQPSLPKALTKKWGGESKKPFGGQAESSLSQVGSGAVKPSQAQSSPVKPSQAVRRKKKIVYFLPRRSSRHSDVNQSKSTLIGQKAPQKPTEADQKMKPTLDLGCERMGAIARHYRRPSSYVNEAKKGPTQYFRIGPLC